MTFRLAVVIGCTATLGFTALASASVSPAGRDVQTFERAKLVQVVATKSKYMRSGIPTSTADVDGDGTSDVVVAAPPKPKHKSVRKIRKHK